MCPVIVCADSGITSPSFYNFRATGLYLSGSLTDVLPYNPICAVMNIRKWIREIDELQDCKVTVPIIADENKEILKNYGCTKERPPFSKLEVCSNGMFMVDTDKIVRLALRYSPSIGRNFYEMLRSFDALQLSTYHKVVTPVNWCVGQDVFVEPSVDNDTASAMLPKGYVEIKPWFRLTPAPDTGV